MSQMPFREAGKGRPILLLHGWTLDGSYFPAQLAGLSEEAHLIAPDLPGHGANRDALRLSIEEAADACFALIESQNLDGVVLVGWSMGAAVAWSMMQRLGQARVAGLVVIDMTPRVLNNSTWNLGIKDGIDAVRSERSIVAMPYRWPSYAEHVAKTVFAEGIEPDERTLARLRRDAMDASPSAMAAMWRSLVRQDFRAFLPQIGVPVLIAYGERSRLYTPEVAAWQKTQIANAEVVAFSRSGHAPHLEEPLGFNSAVSAFIRRL